MVQKPTHHNDIELEATGELGPEEPELEAAEESLEDKVRKLKTKLKECESEKIKHLEDLQRARADFLNGKRRVEEQLERDRERIIEQFLTDLLPLIDSFDTAMAHGERWESLDPGWRQGIEAIHAQLMSIMKSHGIEAIDPTGQPFDPHEHEAVSNVPVHESERVDTVITVLQKGFRRNDTIIRPAKVTVGIEA